MTELQGAVGLAQLRKLERVVEAHRTNAQRIREAVGEVPKITWRASPRGAYETADAVVFHVESPATARAVRRALVAEGLGTKILPEAVTWHFAGTRSHIPELVAATPLPLGEAWPRSAALLERSIALPVMVHMSDDVGERMRRAIEGQQSHS